jgi:hypothetical protein
MESCLWSKIFAWGFIHITLDNDENKFSVDFFTAPTDELGKVIGRKISILIVDN